MKPVSNTPPLPYPSNAYNVSSLGQFDQDLTKALYAYLGELARRANAGLPMDGSEPMQGDLNMGGFGILDFDLTKARLTRSRPWGLRIYNEPGDYTNDITIQPGEIVSDGSDPRTMVLTSDLTKQLDAAWAVGTNAGGRDTGSISDNWWYVWVIMRSDTGNVDILYSLSNTSPTMPANYDHKALLGAIWRTGGAIRRFINFDDQYDWLDPVEEFNSGTVSTAGANVTVTGVPPVIGTVAREVALLSTGSSTVNIWIRHAVATNNAAAFDNADINILTSGRSSAHIPITIMSNSIARLLYRSDVAAVGAFVIKTEGFIFPRGRR